VRGAQTLRLDRKPAGLPAYLAWEGPTARARRAGLLWPESAESTARNNLRQTLRRLRTLAGGVELLQGEDVLCLAPGLGGDVALLRTPPAGAEAVRA
jgi:DNA-binding SARP family transcriptional activator